MDTIRYHEVVEVLAEFENMTDKEVVVTKKVVPILISVPTKIGNEG